MTSEVIDLRRPEVYVRSMAVVSPGAHAGQLLREWRARRNLSQFQLARGSAVSARHLSFIETGRARPSREMVVHLAERLDVPLRERNRILLAAGYAPAYGERRIDSEEMAPVRAALERFLSAHEPYPALVVDRRWNLVLANSALEPLLQGIAPDLLEPPVNVLRGTLHPRGLAPQILNFEEWSAHIVHRLRREIAATGDSELEVLLAELVRYPDVCTAPPPVDAAAAAEIVLPLHLRHGEGRLSYFGTVTTFGTAADVTLAELSVEAFYPMDADTAAALSRG